jgi:hypothetical protein
MGLEGFRACTSYSISVSASSFDMSISKLQGAGLGTEAALGMSIQVLGIHPLARYRLDGGYDCKFAHMPAPLRGSDRLPPPPVPERADEVFRRSVYRNMHFWRDRTAPLSGFWPLVFGGFSEQAIPPEERRTERALSD